MAGRRVLLVHHWRTLEDILERYVRSELPDAEVTRAEGIASAAAALETIPFDIIVSGHELADGDGAGLAARRRDHLINAEPPFVLLTSTPSEENVADALEEGVDRVLGMPFSARDLALLVNELAPEHACREYDRVCIPGLGVVLRGGGAGSWEGEVINISEGGMLADFAFREDVSSFLGRVAVELALPEVYGGACLAAEARFVRLEALTLDEDEAPVHVRTAWRFLGMSDDTGEQLAVAIADTRSIPWPGEESPLS